MKVTSINSKKIILSSLNEDKNYEPTRDIRLIWGDKVLDVKDVVIDYEIDHKYDLRGDHLDALRFGYQTLELQLSAKPRLGFLIGNTTV